MATKNPSKQNQLIGGVILLALGGLFLAGQFLGDSMPGLLIVPAVGTLFLIWGILTRHAGPIIPGGIVTGVGVGLLLSAGTGFEGDAFMISLGLGFIAVTVATALFTPSTHWWALIPGGINVIVGLSFSLGDTVWRVLNWWPLILIAIGAYILINRVRDTDETENQS